MAQDKTLPPRTKIYVVTGISGYMDDKTTWLVSAYTEKTYADKAAILLNRLADKLCKSEEESDIYSITYSEIRHIDNHGDIRDGLYYYSDEVMVVV